jgi:chemotaxis response regulator CheB
VATTNGDSSDQASDQAGRLLLDALVVVGSSAGGIEALTTLVASLPAGFPAPIILAQHLDPTLSQSPP